MSIVNIEYPVEVDPSGGPMTRLWEAARIRFPKDFIMVESPWGGGWYTVVAGGKMLCAGDYSHCIRYIKDIK